PPGVGPFFKQLYEAGFTKRGGRLACVYYDENTLNINAPHEIEGLASCLDYFRAVTKDEPGSARIQAEYDKQFPGNIVFAAGSAATGMYRGLRLWEAAVKEARSVDRRARPSRHAESGGARRRGRSSPPSRASCSWSSRCCRWPCSTSGSSS